MDLSDQMNKYFAMHSAAKRREIQRRRSMPDHLVSSDIPPFVRYIADGKIVDVPDDALLSDHMAFVEGEDGRMLLGIYPTPNYRHVTELAHEWKLHPMLVEDLLLGSQRPKLERYDDVTLMVVRAARYIDDREEVVFSEFHVLVRDNAVAILCQDNRWIDGSAGVDQESKQSNQERWEKPLISDKKMLRMGPAAVVYRFLDEIVDGYIPVLRGLGIDKEQIERQVFSGDQAVAERIYRLSQEIIDTQHSTSSMTEVVRSLRTQALNNKSSDKLVAYLNDLSDHLTFVNSTVAEYRDAMSQILNVNATLVTERQNEDMKKISGWAAILFAPTLIGAIYGMNFDNMPELHWEYGYPMSLGLMLLLAIVLYIIFKKSNWL